MLYVIFLNQKVKMSKMFIKPWDLVGGTWILDSPLPSNMATLVPM